MAITDWWLGDAGTDYAKIVVRSDTNGTLSASASSGNFNGDIIDTSVDDGIGTVTVSGLSKNETVSVSVAGSRVNVPVKLMPESAPFSIGWYSCIEIGFRMQAGDFMVEQHNVAASFGLGDLPYSEHNTGTWGVSYVGASTAGGNTVQNAQAHLRAFMRNSGVKKLSQSAPFYRMGDDHEWPADDWDHTLANATSQGLNITTQAEVDDTFNIWNTALTAYQKGNPTGTYAGATSEKPSNADASTPVSNYPPAYFRKVIGNAEFFFLDCITHRSPTNAVDDATKHMLGSVQESQLLAALSESTATFKVIVSPKVFFASSGVQANQDSWGWYRTRRNVILDYIRDNNIATCFIISGDQHTPQISYTLTENGEQWDMFEVCACPVSVPLTGQIDTVPENKELLDWANQVYGIVKFFDDYCLVEQYTINGRRVSSTRLNAGSNAPILANNRYSMS